MFDLTDIAFVAGGRPLLEGISLRLDRGLLYGVIGANGAGKSTLLRLMAGQERPTRGELRLDGLPLAALPARQLARRIAFLPQSPPPAGDMCLAELVGLGRYPWTGPFRRLGDTDRRAVEHAMGAAGLAGMGEQLVATLSGGERQRGWIAMMLAQSAGCLLMDEPTAALDLRYQVEVLTLLRSLARRPEAMAVVVLHDINLAARFCDRLIGMAQGRIVAEGRVEEVMRPEILQRIYGLPLRVIPDPQTGSPIALY
ncbi:MULTISPECIES: ABC transporter ATP-binding protein [unclassified Haematobacter]|uniref:ABC transporter ATP-binding protein n=1 Tax=unclassified Haematobacter TaxID=2640585 RepID=UPI0025BD6887|nr:MULTISPECIES: ABC transporter ATP-binding protein [unclassified Haematobacter]